MPGPLSYAAIEGGKPSPHRALALRTVYLVSMLAGWWWATWGRTHFVGPSPAAMFGQFMAVLVATAAPILATDLLVAGKVRISRLIVVVLITVALSECWASLEEFLVIRSGRDARRWWPFNNLWIVNAWGEWIIDD